MGSSPAPAMQLIRIPRSLTAPDAWIAILLASFLQHRQYTRRKQMNDGKGKIHAGARSKPKHNRIWSLVHECLFTNLHMFVSPLSSQASGLNAEMVDLQSERGLKSYAKKVASASGKTPKKKPKGDNVGKTMEVRSRRIVKGEMVHDALYPALETTFNLALSIIVGLVSRWLLGLIRSLGLSSASSISLGGPGGHCCSAYTGEDDEGTRLAGSFERMLACILIKQEGDNAGTSFLSLLLFVFFGVVLNLAWFSSKNDKSDPDNEKEKGKKRESDVRIHRIHPGRVKRFIVGVVATLSSLMLFHTPALLRMWGLDGLTEAVEEWGARILLFGNLLGIVSLPKMDTLEEPAESLRNLTNGLLVILALAWGYIASGMMSPIEETARNAAHVLLPSASRKRGKSKYPNEMLDLINVRMMVLIQAMAPFIILCTYFFSARFDETTKIPARGGQLPFSKQYLQNGGLFVRVVLSWCFVGATLYTLRPLMQSFLDQATTVASAMVTLGEDAVNHDVNPSRGSRNKRNTASTSQMPPPKGDPFNDRYKRLVLTAGRIAAFPAFVLAILSMAHLRGGDGSTHPGVGHISQSNDAPRALLPVKGLLPPYSHQCMIWIVNESKPHHKEAGAGDALLHTAALSQSLRDPTPFRDSAHKKIVNWFGKEKFCYPPEVRSIKAVGRHVNFLLDEDNLADGGSILTSNPRTGRELLDMAPHIPVTAADILLGRTPVQNLPKEGSCDVSNTDMAGTKDDSNNSKRKEECKLSGPDVLKVQHPSFSEMLTFLFSHNFVTPTIVAPIFDTIAFLSCVWWNYWYSAMMIFYWAKLRGAASLRIGA